MAGGTLSERLADYWAGATFKDLPASVIAAAKRSLLDTLAVGVAGADAAEPQAILRSLHDFGPPEGGASTVWGRSQSLAPMEAALVNGTSAHTLELDDFGGCGHNGAVVIPAVAAVAEAKKANGRDVLTAIVAGYDVATRVTEAAGGYRLHKEKGWHSTGTCGTFGASAGTAKILGLDGGPFADALGLAGSFTGGIWAFIADGAMSKRYHPGRAAETGLRAALLARAGLTGPRQIMEAPWGGFLATYAGEIAKPDALVDRLGQEFLILKSGIKPYACCRGIHSSLDALFDLLSDTTISRDSIAGFVVYGVEQTRRQLGGKRIETVLDAQFSLPYALAVATESGRATLDQFCPPRRGNATIERLMAATEVKADGVIRFGEEPLLEVRLTDGRSIRRRVPFPKGAPENPISDGDLQSKVWALLLPVLGDAATTELIERLSAIERCEDFGLIAGLLRPRLL